MLLVADKEMFYARYYSPDIAGIESLAPPLLSEITLNNDPANLPAPFPFAFLVKNIHRAFNSSIESPGYDLIASALPVDSADNGAPFANVTIVSYFVSLLSRVFPTPSSSLPSVNNRNHFSRDTCNPDRSNNASDFNEQTPGISNFYIFRWDSISFSLSLSQAIFIFLPSHRSLLKLSSYSFTALTCTDTRETYPALFGKKSPRLSRDNVLTPLDHHLLYPAWIFMGKINLRLLSPRSG